MKLGYARSLWCLIYATIAAPLQAGVVASPQAVTLDSPEATQQLLVWGQGLAVTPESQPSAARQPRDLTRVATYESLDPTVAQISAEGLVVPFGEGNTRISVHYADQTVDVDVTVTAYDRPRAVSFQNEVIPILSKAGCNSGGCHGKAEGQNGFKLSVFGFDPASDYEALTSQGRGRRIFPAAPESSLLLRKATGEAPHGGGQRFKSGSLWFRKVARWIAEGARYDRESASPVERLEVEPAEQILSANSTQQLRVTAIDQSGRSRCVTTEADYASNAAHLADVNGRGLVTASDVPGQAAILVRYMGQVAVCRIIMPRPEVRFARPSEHNFIDGLVWNQLERLGIEPSPLAGDAMFLRRVFLDTIGTLPTPDEAREFLADPSPDKRLRLIDRLLNREEYADYWTMRFADILRVDKVIIGPQAAVGMTRWLLRRLAENRPYDEWVRELVTAQGDVQAEGPAAFYKALPTPELVARSISQVFLGVRIECAQCHHHPFEKWGQDDYFALAGFFTGVGKKPLPGGGEAVVAAAGSDLNHPRTGTPVLTRALRAPPPTLAPQADRRLALADWMQSDDNPYFAAAIANRLWAHYMGRGLVEPVDDLRATNPATNEPLLSALADHMRELHFDLRLFTRTLLSSRVYQLDCNTSPLNAGDDQNYSHAPVKTLPAEVLLDAVCQATGAGEKFNGWPEGYRAIQVWDNQMPSYFFRIFGRPERVSVCECERSTEPSIAQALHLMNSPEILAKIESRGGRARMLAASQLSPRQVIDELYLGAVSRLATDAEAATLAELFESVPESAPDRTAAVQDALWAILNTKEFLYNH